jgi:thioredoxin reductase (NADPH)
MAKKYDVMILGIGPAGFSAAVYAARYGLSTLVIGKEPGGMVSETSVIENYLGFPSITGADLTNKFEESAKSAGAEVVLYKGIESIKKSAGGFEVTADEEKYSCKALIIALGTKRRKLNIPGEKEFKNKGVSYCVTCDGPLFKDKVTAVVGGRNAAVTAAIFLAKRCKKVYLIYRREKLRSDASLTKQLKKEKKIEVVYNSDPVSVQGDKMVNSITIDTKGKKSDLKIDGLFIEIGAVPSSKLVTENLKLKLDEDNRIEVKSSMESSVKGVFAAGDITTGSNKLDQIATAVGEGAIAGNSVFRFIKKIKY